MIGRNVFSEVLGGRIRLSESFADDLLRRKAFVNKTTPCIFLSHKGDDKKAVIDIGKYIMNAGINVYIDVDDIGLQAAAQTGNDTAICKYIELGIANSTHLMAVVSEKTKSSWWVSYEVGYAKRNNNELSTLKLKDVRDLPSFLKITTIVEGIDTLNKYLIEVNSQAKVNSNILRYTAESKSEGGILLEWYSGAHPLKDYMTDHK